MLKLTLVVLLLNKELTLFPLPLSCDVVFYVLYLEYPNIDPFGPAILLFALVCVIYLVNRGYFPLILEVAVVEDLGTTCISVIIGPE